MRKKQRDERAHPPVETGHDKRSTEKPETNHPKAPDGISGYFR